MGRPTGSANKVTVTAKEALTLAFQGLGGHKALVRWAKASPHNTEVFYTKIWPKLIPLATEAVPVEAPPPTPQLHDPNVLAAALALDEAVDHARINPVGTGPVLSPEPHVGAIPPPDPDVLTSALHEATAVPGRAVVQTADDPDPAPAR